jgi:hypothetical protein
MMIAGEHTAQQALPADASLRSARLKRGARHEQIYRRNYEGINKKEHQRHSS